MISLSELINGKIILVHGCKKVLTFGLITMLLAGMTMLFCYLLFKVNALAFDKLGKRSGVAASIYSCIQTFGAMIIGTIAAKTHETNQIPLACIIIFSSAMSILISRKD